MESVAHTLVMKTFSQRTATLALMAITCAVSVFAGQPYNVRERGAKGDGASLDTEVIQKALDACAAGGGGTVVIPAGRFVTGTLHLRSGVTLQLEAGARLVGTTNLAQYAQPSLPAFMPEAKWGKWHRGLLVGENIEDAAVTGPGTIDGNKVFDPTGEERMRGPHAMVFVNCRRLILRDVSVVDAANYGVFLQITDDVEIRNVRFVGGWDGVHWRGAPERWCRNVSILGCQFFTGDDAIAGRYWDNTVIKDCLINSSCNGVRLIGPATRLTIANNLFRGPGEQPHRTSGQARRTNMLSGIILQPGAWDATQGRLDDVLIANNVMQDVASPVTLWAKPGNTVGRVTVSGLHATGVYRSAFSVESWAETPITNVVLRNVQAEFTGGGTFAQSQSPVKGPGVDARPLPAWGLYARHVQSLTLEDVRFSLTSNDIRPVVYADRVERLTHDNFRFPSVEGVTQPIVRTNTGAARARNVLLEAEQFADTGGWDVDQQSMEQMGSSYLLAHGLGVPVKDAVTLARFPAPGVYHVWVRTRDWVAPWKAPGAPGRFQVLVDGIPLGVTFGTQGAEWHWQEGGSVRVGSEARVALHDLTGFEGRCDAVLFTQDSSFVPPNERMGLAKFRRFTLGLSEEPEDAGRFDLVVVGGGIAGTSAALSAARNGLQVALVQDRPVLGGNGSSEVRVWPEGKTRQEPYPHIGDIVEELVAAKYPGAGNAKSGGVYDDRRKLDLVKKEPRITLFMGQRVLDVAASGGRIDAVTAQDIRTARRIRLRAALFADCTGDGSVGFLAGADFEMSKDGVMGASNLWNLMDTTDPAQVLQCECKDRDAVTIAVKEGRVEAPFPRCPWAVDLSDKPFPGRKNFNPYGAKVPLDNLGGWFWESGFDKDMTTDIERIRDTNFRAMYGAWDALKNVDGLYKNHRLGWAAFIAGKRESRRLLGDVILTGDDFRNGTEFDDGAFPCSWHIDIHAPHPDFDKGHKGDEFISTYTRGDGYTYKSPYWAPYRALYSRNVDNLFMAGRDISVTHEALGPVRVMRTCGMMGEIVGKAAWIAVRHKTTPRGVYETHLPLLKELMKEPGAFRRATPDSPL